MNFSSFGFTTQQAEAYVRRWIDRIGYWALVVGLVCFIIGRFT